MYFTTSTSGILLMRCMDEREPIRTDHLPDLFVGRTYNPLNICGVRTLSLKLAKWFVAASVTGVKNSSWKHFSLLLFFFFFCLYSPNKVDPNYRFGKISADSYLCISSGCRAVYRASPAYSWSSLPRTPRTKHFFCCWTASGYGNTDQTLFKKR